MSLKTDSGLKHDTASAGVATGVLGALVAASVLVFYWNTAVSIVDKWMTSSSFNHGFLILPVCAFLMWERRSVLAAMKPNGSFVGIAVLFGAVFSWLIGRITGTLVIEQFALVVIIQSAVIAVMGWRFAAAIAFPLFYMLFAVPFGDFLTPSLQSFTALFVDSALRQAGVPVFTDGFMITIPVGNFEVAEICSGLRFLTATTALGVLCANLLYRSWPKRIFFVGLAVTIPIVANGVRAFGIVYMAHTLDSTTAATVDHITYGWVFFSIVTVILLGIGMTFRDKEAQFLSASPAARGGAGMPSAGSNRLLVATTMGAILVLSAGPAFMVYADSKNAA
ncbi:MAG: exosortase A, partial [Rhodospirillales bacterium]|nr:exosortase A [Rhodospirillales bacterium]